MSSSVRALIGSNMELGRGMKEDQKLYRYKGVLYPVLMSPEENLKALERLEAREDDVMLVSYPKCGQNWMVAVLCKIITAATGERTDPRMHALIEFNGPEQLQVVAEAASPRCLSTHMLPDNIPASFMEKKTKMLVIFRNPKDTAVSFYHFCTKNPVLPTPESWDHFYSQFMSGEVPFGSYFDHALAWEERMDDPNVMIVTFEELKQDLGAGVRRMAEFFGFSLTAAQVQTIAQESSFSALKESAKHSHGPMSDVFFRKGEVGDWRNHFSPDQSQEMDAAVHKHLAGTKLGARLKY